LVSGFYRIVVVKAEVRHPILACLLRVNIQDFPGLDIR